jgi:hypothetical protein
MIKFTTVPKADGVEERRYRGVRVLGSCEHCGMPVPLMGPVREISCTHCLEINQRPVAFWAALVDTADCSPDTKELQGHEVDIKVVSAVPVEVELATSDAPEWLRDRVRAVRRFIGAECEGDGGDGPTPNVVEAPRPVVMSCPKCSASLDITTDSQRTTTCSYCRTDVYLPDDLWRRLHPVKKAEYWYIEYSGESSDARRNRLRWEQNSREREQLRRQNLRGALQRLQDQRAALEKEVRLIPLQLLIAPVLCVVMYVWNESLFWSLVCGGGVFAIHAACVLPSLYGKRRALAKLKQDIAYHKADLDE